MTGLWTTPTSVGLDGRRGPIDLMGRGYLKRGDAAPDEFGFYLYLVVQVGAREKDRVAAATAFLELTKAGDYLGNGAQPSEIALLLVPIHAGTEPTSAQELLHGYDQARADIIKSRVVEAGGELSLVSIVGYPRPIVASSTLDRSKLVFADACGDVSTVRQKIELIHAQLRKGEFEAERSIVIRVLAAFDAIGRLVTTGSLSACAPRSN
jgi:hypothetical protein